MVIFHCYVSLPEGTPFSPAESGLPAPFASDPIHDSLCCSRSPSRCDQTNSPWSLPSNPLHIWHSLWHPKKMDIEQLTRLTSSKVLSDLKKWVDVWWCGVFCQDWKARRYCLIWLVHFLIVTKKARIDPEISGCICIQADHVVYSFKTRHSKHDFDSQIGTTRFKSSWWYFAPIQTNCALNWGIYLPKWSIQYTLWWTNIAMENHHF